MSEMSTSMESQIGSIQTKAMEGLVSTYFDRTFMVLNTFMDDPRECLAVNEGLYRTVDEFGELSEQALFGTLVDRVRGLSSDLANLKGLSNENVLCWLIKETSDLKYADISKMMGMDRIEVKEAIAEVRWHLLG